MKVELTPEELNVLDHTVDLWNAFVKLPDHHSAAEEEVAQYLHRIQENIMARLARRTHPGYFN